MDRQQESVDLESARGGVRRPRSEAARRPRPQSRFLSALTDSQPSASHPLDGSYREVVDEETVDAEAQEKSANDRPRESDADVMGVDMGVVRREVLSGKTEDGKDIRLYSRNGDKDHKQQDRLQSTRYEGRGDRDEYKAGRNEGQVRKDDGRSSRDEVRGEGSHDGKGGQYEGRAGRDEGRFSFKGDVHKGSRFSEREESETERRNNSNGVGCHEGRGDWRNGSGRHGASKPEFERMKRPEKSMKEIVEREKHLKENGEKFKRQRIHGSERDKSGWSKEHDDRGRDAGKERGDRDRSQTVQTASRKVQVGSGIKPKSAEKFLLEQKRFVPTKLKLKVGGITHTLVSDSMKKKPVSSTLEIQVPLKGPEPDDAEKNKKRRHRLILQDSDEEDEMTEPKLDYPPPKANKDTDRTHSLSFRPQPEMREGWGDHSSPSVRLIGQSRAKPLFEPKVVSEAPSPVVRKSSRIPKRRVLDGDEEESEDANQTQRQLLHGRGVQRAEEDIEEDEGQQPEEEDSEDEDLIVKAPGVISDEEDLEDLEEEDDQEVAGRAKRAKVQQLHGSGSKGKPSTGAALTARQRSMQSSKEADGDAVLSLIEFPGGLGSPLGRKGKGKLSESERQVKRAEAAHRRKQQVEKAAIEIQATAIQKILGQDSTRKRREDCLHKQRQEIEQEKKMAELVAATNSIRWSLGPSGTVVSFAEDVGLPNFFNTGPCRYPPPREKCSAPLCPNTYKYRDSSPKCHSAALNAIKWSMLLCQLSCW